MGRNSLRQMRTKECRWTDKDAPRHKHNYCIHSVARVKISSGFMTYHDVMKCDNCNSFVAIQRQGSLDGLIREYDDNLPMIKLCKSRKMLGFSDCELEKE